MYCSNTKKDRLAVKESLTGFPYSYTAPQLCIIIVSYYLEGFEESPRDFDEHQSKLHFYMC